MLMELKISNKLWEIYKYNNNISIIKAGIIHSKHNSLLFITTNFIHLEKILKAQVHLKIKNLFYLKKIK